MNIVKMMIATIVCTILMGIVLGFGIAYVAMILWNIFCTYINLGPIGYWQMWALVMILYLVSVLFGAKIKTE